MEKLRLIRDGPLDPYLNMAVDEAIATCVGAGRSLPTLRLYGWSPSAVSIGYFQELAEEVDLGFCTSHDLIVVRRITGGGAVLHGEGELTYSMAATLSDPAIPIDVQESYRVICSPIVAALRALGADAEFRPVNDIEVGGRKVSGNAQTRRFGAILQHGTILLSLDRSLLPSLRVRKEKLEGKGAERVAERVTTLREILGEGVGMEDVAKALVGEFASAFACPVLEGTLTEEEEELLPALMAKYSSRDWLRRR